MAKVNLTTPSKPSEGNGKTSEALGSRSEYIEDGFGTYHK